MYCQNCGKKLGDNAKFCQNCGQEAIKPESSEVKQVQNTTKQLKVTLATFLWFLFGISTVFRLTIDFFSLSVTAYPFDSYGILGVFLCLSIYFLPTIICLSKHYRNTVAIFSLNLLLGLGAGIKGIAELIWIVALIWSVSGDKFENLMKRVWKKK